MQVDTSGWSGDGEFTHVLVDCLRDIEAIALLRVEDAPSGRAEANYQFVSNEIFVAFARPAWFSRWLSRVRGLTEPRLTLAGLEAALTARSDVGAPDYSDGKMLQYLRTRRVVPPYQTRGYKLVELVRVYETEPVPKVEQAPSRH